MNEKFEIYKLAVEMADRVSSRRMTANGFFLTVETTLLAIFGFLYPRIGVVDPKLALIVISVIGVVLGITWHLAIRSYRRLNRAKFDVINELEKDLAFQYFTREWVQLKGGSGEVSEPKGLKERWVRIADRYTDLTVVETFVPSIFVSLNVVALLAAIFRSVS